MAAIRGFASRPTCSIFRVVMANRRSVRITCERLETGRTNSRSRISTGAATSIRHGEPLHAGEMLAAADAECAALDPAKIPARRPCLWADAGHVLAAAEWTQATFNPQRGRTLLDHVTRQRPASLTVVERARPSAGTIR